MQCTNLYFLSCVCYHNQMVHSLYYVSIPSLFAFLTVSIGALGLHAAFFGEGVGIIFVDDADCIGNETSILDCSHLGIGTSNCFHNEDVSVLCQGKVTIK